MSSFANLTKTQDGIAKLLAARLNHDYVSPLTAISNALEILRLDESQADMALELIEDSVQCALKELQFNRIAYGAYGADEMLSTNEIQRRLQDYLTSEKLSAKLQGITEPQLKSDAKLWFLAILCLKSSFLNIDSVTLSSNSEGWKIIATGTGMKDRSDQYRAENHWLKVADTPPSMIHFPLFHMHAERTGYDIIMKRKDDTEITLNLWRKT